MTDRWRGSPDLDNLRAELAKWPAGYRVHDIHTAGVWSNGPDPKPGMSHWAGLDGWCVTVEQDGYEPRDRWLHWGDSIKDAADKLAEFMRVRRENPHILHIEGCRWILGCAGCAKDVRDYPEWAGNMEPEEAPA